MACILLGLEEGITVACLTESVKANPSFCCSSMYEQFACKGWLRRRCRLANSLNLKRIESISIPAHCRSTISQRLLSRLQVDYNATDEYNAINNYKVLQAGFNKLKIDKVRTCRLSCGCMEGKLISAP